jgi:hypothetical protein
MRPFSNPELKSPYQIIPNTTFQKFYKRTLDYKWMSKLDIFSANDLGPLMLHSFSDGQVQCTSKGLVTRAILCAISCPICCQSQMQFGVSAIWCRTRNCYRLHVACDGVAIWCCDLLCEQTRTRNRTPNHICNLVQKKKIGSDSCRTPNRRYTKSHLQFAANCMH